MGWRECRMADERLRFVVQAEQGGESKAALCRRFGISRQCGYKWLRRFREGGAAAVLAEGSRRPRRSPRRSAEAVRAAVVAEREKRPDWGARKLLVALASVHPELPKLTPSTVHRILRREQLVAEAARERRAVQRFERGAPNELWQMDFKGPQGGPDRCPVGPLSILDDHSRYLVALAHVGSTQLRAVQAVLEAAFRACGLPDQLLVDHGTPWYNGYSPWGWSELSVWILRQGVRLVLSRVRHPQTQGKVERLHGALQAAVRKRHGDPEQQSWLDEFRHEYNHLRPHQGLGMQIPATRWQPSPRPYRPQPPEWSYPAQWLVRRLGQEGQLNWLGRRWEISRALRGQRIGLEPVGLRVLVHYCNLTLREIDLANGVNTVLPANPFRFLQG